MQPEILLVVIHRYLIFKVCTVKLHCHHRHRHRLPANILAIHRYLPRVEVRPQFHRGPTLLIYSRLYQLNLCHHLTLLISTIIHITQMLCLRFRWHRYRDCRRHLRLRPPNLEYQALIRPSYLLSLPIITNKFHYLATVTPVQAAAIVVVVVVAKGIELN